MDNLVLVFCWLLMLSDIGISVARVAETDSSVRHDPDISNGNERSKRQVSVGEPCTGVGCPESSSGTTLTATEALAEQDQQAAVCASGINGINTFLRGRDGRDGRDGTPGSDGQDGIAGETGRGSPGERGEKGYTGAPGQDIPHPGNVGTTYVRWGRRTCPSNASLVYEGLAASGYYDTGGGSNFLCLPYEPEYLQTETGEQGRAVIYSTEYQVDGFPPQAGLHDHEVPCAVCRVSRRGTMLMIPAKTQCPSNWSKEYQGYLMTAHYAHAGPKEYLCVDENAEPTSNSNSGDQNGALLYVVEARCGGIGNLPCGPYISGDELACVVCTL